LADAADFNLPFGDEHYLYDCFGANEIHGRIDEHQFFASMTAGVEQDDNVEQEKEQK